MQEDSIRATQAADMWALGLLAFELLSGQPVFRDDISNEDLGAMLAGYASWRTGLTRHWSNDCDRGGNHPGEHAGTRGTESRPTLVQRPGTRLQDPTSWAGACGAKGLTVALLQVDAAAVGDRRRLLCGPSVQGGQRLCG